MRNMKPAAAKITTVTFDNDDDPKVHLLQPSTAAEIEEYIQFLSSNPFQKLQKLCDKSVRALKYKKYGAMFRTESHVTKAVKKCGRVFSTHLCSAVQGCFCLKNKTFRLCKCLTNIDISVSDALKYLLKLAEFNSDICQMIVKMQKKGLSS